MPYETLFLGITTERKGGLLSMALCAPEAL